MAEVCVDASFALKLVLHEPEREQVRSQWARWLHDGFTVIVPWLWTFETHSVLRRKVTLGELTDLEGREAWRILRRQGTQTVHPRGLFDRAWAIATDLRRSTTYDAVYVALAELRRCELWTADQRLVNAAASKYPGIRSL
ncbi:MAG: type II toxin-antitoxin system VapC family toxin [Chloroflexi bacterium]|nr:type II toxin-antitoxin system VapC family toxin [Chloroflexota bacterium]